MRNSETLNKPVMPGKKSRNPKGSPRPYRDGNRWKSIGNFVDAQGVSHRVTGTGSTQQAAIKSRDKLLRQKQQKLSMAQLPSNMVLVGDFCQYWLDVIKQGKTNLAPKTYVGYKTAIDKWIKPNLGTLKLQQLSRQHILQLFALAPDKGVSRSLQVQIRSVLKPALDEAVIAGYIQHSPFIKIPLIKKNKGNPKFFTKAEVGSILQASSTYSNSLRWHLALIYGPRQGECLGLRWSDIKLEDGQAIVTIANQLQRKNGQGLGLAPLKTAKAFRGLPITETTRDMFQALKQAHMTARAVNGPDWNPNDFVFVTPQGSPIDPSNDRKEWIKILKAANVEYRSIHTARRTAGTMVANINTASKLLGHSSIQVTADYYAGIPLDEMRESLQSVESNFS